MCEEGRKGGSVVAWCVRKGGREGVLWCVRKGGSVVVCEEGRECCGVVCEEECCGV